MLTQRQFHTWNISFKNEGTQIVYRSKMPDLFFPSPPFIMPNLMEDLITYNQQSFSLRQSREINKLEIITFTTMVLIFSPELKKTYLVTKLF